MSGRGRARPSPSIIPAPSSRGEFDGSRSRSEPSAFPLGRLIKGWQEGLPRLRVSDRCLFAIPANLAYGDRYREPIPANSALLFDIELIAIPAAPTTG